MTEGEAPPTEVRRAPPVLIMRLVGALAALVAAVLAVVGSFLPLVSGSLSRGGTVLFTLAVTGWQLHGSSPSGAPVTTLGGAAQNGVPLTIAAALLVIVALLILLTVPRSSPAVLRAAALSTGAVVVAFFVGVLLTVGIQLGSLASTFQPIGSTAGTAGVSTSVGLGAGFWLEVVAGALAIAAVVLVALPVRTPAASEAASPPADGPPEQ